MRASGSVIRPPSARRSASKYPLTVISSGRRSALVQKSAVLLGLLAAAVVASGRKRGAPRSTPPSGFDYKLDWDQRPQRDLFAP